MKKRVFAAEIPLFLFLMMAVLFGAAGCGSSSSGSTEEEPEVFEVAALETFASECADEGGGVDSADLEGVSTSSAQGTLDCQVNFANEVLEVVEEDGGPAGLSVLLPKNASESSLTGTLALRLVATIDAPVVDGSPLGASDVSLNGDQAVVTYNTIGEPYLGAVQIVDVGEPLRPRLVSQTLFETTDVSAGFLDGRTLYLAAAQSVDVTGFDSPAELLKADLDDSFSPSSFSDPVSLPSFVATDLAAAGDSLYLTTGDTGGLVKVDPATLEQEGYLELDDARSVAYNERDGLLYVFQGTSGRVVAVNPETLAGETFAVGGATIAESKSTIEVRDGLLFIGAGDGGALIVDPEDGTVLETIENPAPDTELEVANAVAVQDDVFFVSNGEAGIRVVSWARDPDGGVTTRVIGTLNFEEDVSANSIAYHGDFLVIASGIGGIRLVKVITSPYIDGLDCSSITAVFCDDFAKADGAQINDDIVWKGSDSARKSNASVIGEGGRIDKNKAITTLETFDNATGKHYSLKLFKSGLFTVHNYKDKDHGIQVRYDGGTAVTAYIGQINNSKKRKTVNFTLPAGQAVVIAHVYQEGAKVQVSLELGDGTKLESPEIATTDSKLLDDTAVRLAPYDGNDQSKTEPSFDDVLVEEFTF